MNNQNLDNQPRQLTEEQKKLLVNKGVDFLFSYRRHLFVIVFNLIFIVIAFGLGYGLDYYFGTWPKIAIVLFLFSFPIGQWALARTLLKKFKK